MEQPDYKQMVLPRLLRNEDTLGLVGLASGDPVMGNVGTALSKSAESNVNRIMDYNKLQQTEQGKADQRRILENYYNSLAEQGKERNALAREANALKLALAGKKADLDKSKRIDQGVSKLSDKLDDANVPRVSKSMNLFDQELRKYVGPNEVGNIPGVGRVEGRLPLWAQPTTEGKQLRNKLKKVEVELYKMMSGTAVSEHEAQRLQEAFALVVNADEDTFVKSWQDYKTIFNETIKNILARGDEDVQAEYFRRRGIQPSSMMIDTSPYGEQVTPEMGGYDPSIPDVPDESTPAPKPWLKRR